MFDWGALKRGVPESVRFCIDDLPMYTFLIPTHKCELPLKVLQIANFSQITHSPTFGRAFIW